MSRIWRASPSRPTRKKRLARSSATSSATSKNCASWTCPTWSRPRTPCRWSTSRAPTKSAPRCRMTRRCATRPSRPADFLSFRKSSNNPHHENFIRIVPFGCRLFCRQRLHLHRTHHISRRRAGEGGFRERGRRAHVLRGVEQERRQRQTQREHHGNFPPHRL